MALTQDDLQAISALIDTKLSVITQNLQAVKDDLQTVKDDLQAVKGDLQTVKDKVTNLEITLETETNRNIEIIAEGHLDLTRKLDEAIKSSHENDLYKLRVNMLDAEIKKMKRA